MININKILGNKKIVNLLYFVFFTVLIIVITIGAFIYMDYITPKLEVKDNNLEFQKRTRDNIVNILSSVEMVNKKNIKPIKVKKGENIKVETVKDFSLEPNLNHKEYVNVAMYKELKEEDIKVEQFKYVKDKNDGYYFTFNAPEEEGLYTYNLNLEYRNTQYIFTLHIEVK